MGHSCMGRQLLGSHGSGGATLPDPWAWQLYLQQPPGPARPSRHPEQPRHAQALTGLVAVTGFCNLSRETNPCLSRRFKSHFLTGRKLHPVTTSWRPRAELSWTAKPGESCYWGCGTWIWSQFPLFVFLFLNPSLCVPHWLCSELICRVTICNS